MGGGRVGCGRCSSGFSKLEERKCEKRRESAKNVIL